MRRAFAREQSRQHPCGLRQQGIDLAAQDGCGHVAIATEKHPGDADDRHDQAEQQAEIVETPAADTAEPGEEQDPQHEEEELFAAMPSIWSRKLVRPAKDMRIAAAICAA